MFNYKCEECGKGTVKPTVFHDHKTRIKGYPFVVPEAIIGVCDNEDCGAKHYSARETKRWEELYNKDLDSRHIFLSSNEILNSRKLLGLSMEDFAYLIGCTRQSIYNWEKEDRQKSQSRMGDLLIKLVRYSSELGNVNVISFLVEEARKLGIEININKKNVPLSKDEVIRLNIRKAPKNCLEVGGANNLKLAATTTEKELFVAELPNRDIFAVVQYDFGKANLSLQLLDTSLGLKFAKVETITNDGKNYALENIKATDSIILLIPETSYRENDVKEILLQPELEKSNGD